MGSNKSRLLYCYDCNVAMTACPTVVLPFKFSLITDPGESPSKNTGVHAAILAPGFVDLHE